VRVGFVGLGVMGFPMAGHLARAGHEVTVYNRTAEKAARWVEAHHGRAVTSPADVGAACEIVFTCVGDDPDVRDVVAGPSGVLAGLAPGGIVVDHTTTSAALARELDGIAAAQGCRFLDAPVSGGQAGAEAGRLTVMVGGDEAAWTRAEPAIRAFAHQARRMGPSGAGQLTKMVNQISIAGLIEGLAEGLVFAQRAGLDTDAVLEVLSKGAGQSWQLEHRWTTMAERRFDFGFAVDWMRKDLRIAKEEAARVGAPLPVATLVDGYYADVQALGGSRWDTSSLVARLDQLARGDRGQQT
jgi:3-hydroxyisobutyrate dehydrogenase-like beta-hydroxyacid dehydrogenase